MAAEKPPTEESVASRTGPREPASRGLVIVWAGAAPTFRPLVLGDGLALGRDSAGLLGFDDPRMSRSHCSVAHAAGHWQIADLGSRNGTFIDGQRLTAPARLEGFRVLRVGHCLLLPAPDLRRLDGGVEVAVDGVIGPRLRAVRQAIAAAAHASSTLLITGPTGAGKELAARHFHRSGPRASGPFVVLNCAAIPDGLAERVLFGAVRGAYTGAAADAQGYVQAADGGVFFLDEIGELDLAVQAKLLRFLETREAYAIGATQPRRLDLRICFATHRDLREMVRQGRFREDLYFRISQPRVTVPPLAERPEEIPWLLMRSLADRGAGLTPHPQLVETCLLRPWPGNVRELIGALHTAIQQAGSAGQTVLRAEALDPDAGRAQAVDQPPAAPSFQDQLGDETTVVAALQRFHGNVAQAARQLGVHRNQLRRWLTEHALDPKRFRPPARPN